MVQLPEAFRAKKDHGTMQDGFSPVPDGKYKIKLINSSLENCGKTAKDPNGKYLKFEFEIVHPTEYKGRRLFTNLNIINKNDQTVEIAYRELNTIVIACGKTPGSVQQTEQLHGIPMQATVKQIPDNRGRDYPPKNKITKYETLEEKPTIVEEDFEDDLGPEINSDEENPF